MALAIASSACEHGNIAYSDVREMQAMQCAINTNLHAKVLHVGSHCFIELVLRDEAACQSQHNMIATHLYLMCL